MCFNQNCKFRRIAKENSSDTLQHLEALTSSKRVIYTSEHYQSSRSWWHTADAVIHENKSVDGEHEDLLWWRLKEMLGTDLCCTKNMTEGDRLFQNKIRDMSSEELKVLASHLFYNVKRSSEVVDLVLSICNDNRVKTVMTNTIISKAHEMVKCSGVCLYLLDSNGILVVSASDEPSVILGARFEHKRGLAWECVTTEQTISRSGVFEHKKDFPEINLGSECPDSVLFTPIWGWDRKIIGVIGVFNKLNSNGFNDEDECLVSYISRLAGYTLGKNPVLERQTNKDVKLMQKISNIGSEIAENPKKSIDKLLDLSSKLLHCEQIAFFEMNCGDVICTTSKNFSQRRVPKAEGIVGFVMDSGEIVNLTNASKNPMFNRDVDIQSDFGTTESILAAPVMSSAGDVIGVIECLNRGKTANEYNMLAIRSLDKDELWYCTRDNTGDGSFFDEPSHSSVSQSREWSQKKKSLTNSNALAFSKSDERLVRILANNIAGAFSQAHVFRKLYREQRRNKALINVLKVTSTNTDLPKMLEEIGSATCEIIEAERASIFLVDNNKKHLCAVVSNDTKLCSLIVPIGEGVVGDCFSNRIPIRVPHAYDSTTFSPKVDQQTGFMTKSLLAVPIADARGNFVGVLEVLNKKDEGKFSSEDEELLLAMSGEVGECIRRGLMMSDTATRHLLFASNMPHYPWQSAMLEIYSGNYYQELQENPKSRESYILQQPCRHVRRASEMLILARTGSSTAINLLSNTKHVNVIEMFNTNEFDVLRYNLSDLDDFTFLIFVESQSLKEYNIDRKTLRNFISLVGKSYHQNPYHNYHHGVHVLQCAFYFLTTTAAHEFLNSLDVLAILVASLCHDINHPGHNNNYEIKTKSKLALLYNDISVLENMHANTTMMLLRRKELNIFANFDANMQRNLRKAIIGAIIATDMSKHKSLSTSLKRKDPKDAEKFDIEDPNSRQLLVNIIVHSADISAQVYKWEIAKKWEERVSREFSEQVKKELAKGVKPSSLMVDLEDPAKRWASQLYFCDQILLPFWKILFNIFPKLKNCVDQLEINRKQYQSILDECAPSSAAPQESFQVDQVVLLRKRNKRRDVIKRSKSYTNIIGDNMKPKPTLKEPHRRLRRAHQSAIQFPR